MTTRAAHKISAEDAEDAILGPLNDGDASMLLPGDKDPDGEGADEGGPATGGGASSTGGGVGDSATAPPCRTYRSGSFHVTAASA